MNIRQFKTDAQKETEGVWKDIGDGAALLIARVGNPNFKREYARLRRPYEAQLRIKNALSEELETKIMVEALASTVLLGWRGMTDGDADLPYSRENAIMALTELPEFRDLVAALALDVETFRAEQAEAAAGN